MKFILMILFMVSVNAKNVPIIIEGVTSYPSPASVHLDIIQSTLAQKAVEACGSVEDVDSIADISININNGLSHLSGEGVASIEEGDRSMFLNLWYPNISASAVAKCK